jgi:ribosomal protein S18 acetylase RimI-like enzyme
MIQLRKMTEPEFKKFMDYSIPEYAREKMKGEGLSEEVAKKLAEDSFAQLLPKGLQSESQFLFSILEDTKAEPVGSFWFARKQNGSKTYAFIYDIVLNPEVHGKGYGKLTMRLAEDEAKKAGLFSIGLHVFGHNKTAIGLYEKSGYRVTNQIMVKDI